MNVIQSPGDRSKHVTDSCRHPLKFAWLFSVGYIGVWSGGITGLVQSGSYFQVHSGLRLVLVI